MKRPTSSPNRYGKGHTCRLLATILIIAVCFLLIASSSYPALASHIVSPAHQATSLQVQTTLLQENFDDGAAQGFGNESGDWKVIDGKYTATTGTFRFSTTGDLSWQDYVVEADYINAQDGGLLVRAQDYNNCISLVIRPTYNDICWNIRKNGAWGAGLATVALGYKPGANLHVRIEVAGSDLKGYINGELKTTLKTTEFPKGKISLYLYSQGNQYWDNIEVYTAGTTPTSTPAARGLLYQATLKVGDYGGGSAIPPTTGIVDSSEGVKFVPTESDNQSNALINWAIPADRRAQFRSQGTISLMFKADRQNHTNGEILGDNCGFDAFNNGQSTFSVASYRIPNGGGVEDDQFYIKWSTWHNAVWVYHPPASQPNLILEYDRWYHLGFTWGGPINYFEIWACGALQAQDSQAGAALPWGDASMGTGSGTNVGLGDNHQRDIDQYNSAAGVTFADIRIWDEYKAYGDTQLCPGGAIPTPTQTPVPPTTAAGLVAYYQFDNDYQDRSGSGNQGMLKGSIPFVPAVVGNGAKFDGKSWLEVNDSSSLDLYNSYTFSAWVYKENAGVGGYSVILEKADSSAMDNRSPYGFAHTKDGYNPIVHFAHNNQLTTISSDTRTNFKEWNFLTVTWDGTNVKFYINGTLKATKAWSNPLPNSASKLLIGCGPVGDSEYFVGILDELRIYNRALSQGEIDGLYQQGKPSITPTTTPTSTPSSTTTPPSTTPVITSGGKLIFESASGKITTKVQIPVLLSGVTDPIGNMDITLSYNPSVLRATAVSKGTLTSTSSFDSNILNGTIRLALFHNQGFSGDGSIAVIDFDVIGKEGDTSPLNIDDVTVNRASDSAPINIGIENGIFSVVSALKGDCDGDGKITIADASLILQMAVGKRPVDMKMDINMDGRVSSVDARHTLRAALGLEVL